MLQSIWPLRLNTPHFELGTSFAAGVSRPRELGQVEEETTEQEGHMARVNASGFSVALYEQGGRIGSVWYDDPGGRKFFLGRSRKTRLYLRRFMAAGTWRRTLDNGYFLWWLNEADERLLVYGVHADVIRVNDRRKYDSPLA